jgi:hypothetical protein
LTKIVNIVFCRKCDNESVSLISVQNAISIVQSLERKRSKARHCKQKITIWYIHALLVLLTHLAPIQYAPFAG